MIRKMLALFLAGVLATSALTACGNDKPAVGTEGKETSTSQVQETEVSEETEVVEEIKYPEEISIFNLMSSSAQALGYTSYNEAYWAQALEELTGTHVEWTHPATDVWAEKFNLMIGSEDYTDVIITNWSSVGGIEMYVEDEVVVDITDMIPECMPNFNAYLEEHPEIKKSIQNEEGRILYVPGIKDDIALCVFVGPLVRTDWLEKLNLEVPKNTDDLYKVLKAFKEQDPNGNGIADEIPMSGVLFKTYEHGIGNLLWAFDTHYSFYVEDGKVVWGPAEKKFEEGITYLAKLYDEGLIDVDYLLNDRTAMDSKALADRVGFEFSFQPTKYFNNKDFNDGNKVMMGIPYLTTPDNDSQMCFNHAYTELVDRSSAFAITTACEDPKGVLKWLDTVFSEEGNIIMNYGKEGTHFEYVDGKPFIDYSTLTADEQKEVKGNTQVIAGSFPNLGRWDASSSTYSAWGRQSIDIWAESADVSGILPTISFTEEEKEQIADKLTQLETYADTQMNNVVIGELSMSEWPTVVEKFYDMGLEDILKVYNTAYQRYMNK